ncbi:MAG: hemerythrin domain-containing protein [Clostridia bacterium]|nr:hemerythrin domain-containing protein [Clostridia bacterium]
MNCIELMVEEHKSIKRMLAVIRRYCYKILKNEAVQFEDFYRIIDFVRNYADKHHHGKEENMLFNRMMHELGSPAEKLVRHGMLVEHDLGRLYIQELELAVRKVIDGEDESRLDVISNAMSYTYLLHRHIDKEDNVVFKYASNNLSSAVIEELNRECEKFEQDRTSTEVCQKYSDMVRELEAKVLTK